ncbi:MAG: hypothetical protein KC503_30415 [Myxococcales bacterium]|nr:hypothetical protein [Myxococcales bacterium]
MSKRPSAQRPRAPRADANVSAPETETNAEHEDDRPAAPNASSNNFVFLIFGVPFLLLLILAFFTLH